MKPLRLLLPLLALVACAFAIAACGSDDAESGSSAGATTSTQAASGDKIASNADNAKTTLTIGSKNFTEQIVLGNIYAQALTAAGYTVKGDFNLGDEKTALAALKSGDISAYPEYTGTALLSFAGVEASKIPKEPEAAYQDVKTDLAQDGIEALPPTPFTSSNEVAVTKETADTNGLKAISDLDGKAQDLTLYGSPECRRRSDCLLGLQEVYGLDFKKFTPVDVAQRHEVLDSGKADVSIVFTTDPQIKRNGEVLLEDDKGMFPPYNSTVLVTKEVADKAGPDFAKTVELVQKGLTDEAMQELNARVDIDKKTPEAVAKEYLQESGYTGS